MKELVEYIVKALVDKPESVVINRSDRDDLSVIEINVSPDEVGKVIGKEGRIASAIRTVVKSAAAKQRKRVTVEIVSQQKEEVK